MAYQSVFRPDLFKGQTIIVTGGGSGIGRCTAHELAALGANVAILGRTMEKLTEVQREIEDDGGHAMRECAHDLETGAAQPQCAVRGIPSRHASGSDEAQSTSVTNGCLIDGDDQLAVVVAAIKLGNRAGRVFEPGEDFLIVDDLAVERELCQAGCRCLELGDVVEDDEA
jgi:NAD(P)-dependent dehydrogenase (short-subunit alcohol dehydrogenase family)